MVTLLSLTGERLFRELVRQVAKRLLSYKYSPVLQKPPLVTRVGWRDRGPQQLVQQDHDGLRKHGAFLQMRLTSMLLQLPQCASEVDRRKDSSLRAALRRMMEVRSDGRVARW
jgi:hypothetical protein